MHRLSRKTFLNAQTARGKMASANYGRCRMPQYYMLNKPKGYITAKRDENRPTVMELFPEALREPLHPVGRLDKDTEGLLLFTDDGMFDRFLLRPEFHVEKEYEYLAFGALHEDAVPLLEAGVPLPGKELSKPARAAILGYSTVGACEQLIPPLRRKHFMKNPGRTVTHGILWITEGKRHQVKLMVKAVGGHVFYLKRNAIGRLRLDDTLAPGCYRPLRDEELELLGYKLKE